MVKISPLVPLLLLALLMTTMVCSKDQTSDDDDDTSSSSARKKRKERRKERSSILYDGVMPDPACTDCLCLVYYTLVCSRCAPSTEVLLPCGSTVMDLMIKAANIYDDAHPDDNPADNPFSFTTEYRGGQSGQAVVGLSGIVPTDHVWNLYINSRSIGEDIQNVRIKRGGDSVTFRLVPKAASKRSAHMQQSKPRAGEREVDRLGMHESKPEERKKMTSQDPPGSEQGEEKGSIPQEIRESKQEDTKEEAKDASPLDVLQDANAVLSNAESQAVPWRTPTASMTDEDEVAELELEPLDLNELNALQEEFNTLWPYEQYARHSPDSATRKKVWHLFDRLLKQLKLCAQYADDEAIRIIPPEPDSSRT